MAKKMKVKVEKKAKDFMPCSRCPNPKACTAAGRCLAESFSG